AHAALNPTSTEPAVGASGAVAAAMGAFAVLHTRERMRLALVAAPVLAPRIYFVSWPAWVFLGLWLLEQLFFASFGSTTLGVAFGAHLGGFAFGAVARVAPRKLGLAAGAAEGVPPPTGSASGLARQHQFPPPAPDRLPAPARA